MTGPDLPVEGPRPWPVHPPASSTQPASQKPTDTDGAAVGSWTMSSRPVGVGALATVLGPGWGVQRHNQRRIASARVDRQVQAQRQTQPLPDQAGPSPAGDATLGRRRG